MSAERFRVVAVALLLAYAGIALFVLVDDYRCRREGRGRWQRLDQLLADAAEHTAILKTVEGAEGE